MAPKKINPTELRQQAEEKLGKRKSAANSISQVDTSRLLHELQVHQIELEMQNDELVQARVEAEAIQRQFTDLYDFAPVGYFTLARDGAISRVNLRGMTLLGAGAERNKLLTRRFGLFVSPQSRPAFSAFLEKIFSADGKKQTCEVELLKDKTESFWAQIEAASDDSHETCLAVAVDITERKQADEKLTASEVRYRRLFEATRDGILILDAETGMVVDVNPFLVEMLGYSNEVFLGKKLWELGLFKDIAASKENFRELKKQEYIRYEDLPLETADGRRINVEFISNVYQVDHSKVIQCNIRDITERRQAQEQLLKALDELKRSNTELEQFANITSHDLQEPLRAVAGMVQLLQKRYKGQLDERADEYIGLAVDGATRMQTLINDLLAFSRVERRGNPIRTVEANAALQSALRNLETAIAESGAAVTSDSLPTVQADATQLTQLFQNLVGNAIKFHGERPPQIRVGVEDIGDAWRFTVRDNGIGIDPRYFERVFLVFQRLHTRRDYPGTGIGLSICKKIVERHGGRIWIESAPGQGSTFFFTIPHGR